VGSKTVITVSDANGIKQYNAPKSIKKILIYIILFLILLGLGLFYYMQSLNDKVTNLEYKNETLAKEAQNNKIIHNKLEAKNKELENIKRQKQESEEKLKKEKIALEGKLKSKIDQLLSENIRIEKENNLTGAEKNESDKLLEELTKEIKEIERELEEDIRIKEQLKKKLSLKIKKTKKERKGYVNHLGIYLGSNKLMHASSSKKRVVVTSLKKPFYSSRYKCTG